MSDNYATIRDILGPLIGLTLVDVSQHDKEDWEERGEAFVFLLFSDGSSVKFFPPDDAEKSAFIVDGPAAEGGPVVTD